MYQSVFMLQKLTALKPGMGLFILLCLFTAAIEAQTVITPLGSTWKYLDNGTNQGTAWRSSTFNDVSWKSGPGQLGYGDGDEATVVSYGNNSSLKYTTTYFRKAITITGKNNYTSFKIEYKRDDGIIIYVNGMEIKRDNMPSGTISYTTFASASASDDGSTIKSATIATGSFAEGSNVIAVEIHQNAKTSTDISFDMRLTGNLPASGLDTITRGPYLQMANQNAITIRWATNNAKDSKVRFGTTLGSLGSNVTDIAKTTEHEIRLTGLAPDTKYYYSIGTSAAVLEETNKNFFTTAPPITTPRKIRIAAFGDCGNNSTNQVNVKNAYLNFMGSNSTDLWLLLGDNAYNAGSSNEYQSNFFNIYKNDLLKNIALFPTLGNHDYANNPTRQDDHNIPYLSLFTLPKNAECGGLPSGKEEYYSFDYGDIHFISLDSYGENENKRFYDTTSTQILWLKDDLAANQRKWTIAYWHHPPYTMGSHNSDTESDLVAVRAKLMRILERNGVDLILNGHSHSYERSYLLHNHFGLENTFSFAANTSGNSNARYDGNVNSCAYTTTSAKIQHGTVYVVAGSAGQVGGTQGSFPHSAMYYSNATTGGSLAIEIQNNRLDAKFVGADNTIKDQFTIFKDVNKVKTISVTAGQPATLTASWTGNYSWSTGAVSQSVVVNKTTPGNYNYYVTDNANTANKCLSDTFHVNVVPAIAINNSSALSSLGTRTTSSFSFKVYPNPAKDGVMHLMITSALEQNVRYVIVDINGRIIQNRKIVTTSGATQVNLRLAPGMYVVKLSNAKGVRKAKKIVVQ